jgi:predicted transcriptional regulator
MDDRSRAVTVKSELRRKEPSRPLETPDAKAQRLERERAMIEEGRRDIREGRYIPDHEVDAWLDRLVNDEPLPIPGEPASTRIEP